MNGRKSREVRKIAKEQWKNNNPNKLPFRIFLKHYKAVYNHKKSLGLKGGVLV
jgi:hypothetical protein